MRRMPLRLLAATVFAAMGANAQVGSWQAIAPVPEPRYYTAMAAANGKLYLAPGALTASFNRYDPGTNNWSAPITLALRGEAIAVELNGRIYVVGGCLNSDCNTTTGLVEAVDTATNAVTTPASLATPRFGAAGGAINGKLYVAAGTRCPPCSQPASLEIYDPVANAWTAGPPIPTAREYAASAVSNNKLYVIGGAIGTGASSTATNVVEAYDPLANAWSTAAPMPIAALNAAAATTSDGRIHVTGGHDTQTTVYNHHYVYDPAADTWSLSTPMATARFGHGSAAIGTTVYVAAGAATAGGVLVAGAEVFTPAQAPVTYPLTVQVQGAGSGSVTTAPPGINCPGTCSANFNTASAVTLTATAASGSTFQGFGGACIGAAPCTITMSAAANVTASFALAPAGPAFTPAALAFGGQSFHTTSRPKVLTLANPGNAALTLGTITTSADFLASTSCTSIPAHGSCAIAVTFTPLAEGLIAGAVVVQTSAGTASAQLSGVGEHSLVAHYYSSILAREADSGGKAFWEAEATRLTRLGININEAWYAMAMSFFTSAEYIAMGHGDAAFVADLYRTFFNREPDGAGGAFWQALLSQGMPREVMLVSFMISPEFVQFTNGIFGRHKSGPEVDIVIDFYRGLLGRVPDSGGFDFWLARFRAAQCVGAAAVAREVDAISAEFLRGAEYAARNRSNAQFVGDLYNAFLRRGGDLEGVKFWIASLGSGATREQLRREFQASPEFSARVNAVIAAGCQRLAVGSFDYQGALPDVGRVAYATIAHEETVSHEAYLGWTQLVVAPGTPVADVSQAVALAGGEIIAALPSAGIYRARVAPGAERAFLLAMYTSLWVTQGSAVQALTRGAFRNVAFDGNGGSTEICLDRHGTLVQSIANRRGGAFAFEDAGGLVWSDDLAKAVQRLMASIPEGDRQVLNLSWNVDRKRRLDLYVEPGCDLACVKRDLAAQEMVLLSAIFGAVQRAWEDDPGVGNRTTVTMVLGNPKLAMDPYVAQLKERYPAAFERVVLVGGVDAAGSPRDAQGQVYFNYSDHSGVVFARGVDVPGSLPGTGTVACTGTSFAAPEVASVLDRIWRNNPGLTSAQLNNVLRFAARSNRTLPQDANGFTTNAFIGEAQVDSFGFILDLVTIGNGTLTPSPVGPTYAPGTVVLVLEVPGRGATFTGWSGACTGLLGCVVTMDAHKTVTGTFSTPAVDCTATVSPLTLNAPAAASAPTVMVTIAAGCGWAPTTSVPWITFTPPGGTGSGQFAVNIQANGGTLPRAGTISVGGKTINVAQAGGGTSTGLCSLVSCTSYRPGDLFYPPDQCMCSSPPGQDSGPCGTSTVAFQGESCSFARCAAGLYCVSTVNQGQLCMTPQQFNATQCGP